ncbi:MAG: alpha/beta hydrolase, partial [Clostridiaceae bacterium]|nr:alpha/beta hydrolase [Clostridiaceae bacterium]
LWLEDYGYERYTINADDGTKLIGYLMRPEKPSKNFVFCSHGYRSEGRREFSGISQYYLSRGFNVFLVDHRASGESGGKYIGFGYYEAKDSIRWLEFLNKTFGEDISIVLHGVSMGSATVMLMGGDEALPENVRLIVADCGYTSAWDEFKYKLSAMKIPEKPLLPAVNAINIRKAGYDFRDTSAVDAVKRAKVPFLFIHGGADNFVPTFMVYLLFDACASKLKEMMIVDGADHASSFVAGREQYEAKLDEMLEKTLTVTA